MWGVIAVFTLSIGLIFGVALIHDDYKGKAIKNGCASYNSTTGQFQWNNGGMK